MSALRIKSLARKGVDLAFARLGELVKTATFKKIVAYIPDPLTGVNINQYATAEAGYLRLHFSSQDVDGQTIVYGDEKWLVKASDLIGIEPIPTSGDWFEVGGARYDIRAALLDPTENLWTFHIRRDIPTPLGAVAGEDWGDLAPFASNEAWGGLALADSSEDWNA